ncbi:MAG TPA: FAD-dependent oxidoreductase, partial [Polyangia bacterium]|nr:FAD-dependent oxidoreductase [Polyangia bacterium]
SALPGECGVVRNALELCEQRRAVAASDPSRLPELLDARQELDAASLTLRQILSSLEDEKGIVPSPEKTTYFVLSLPLEQLAYYVDRSTMWTFLAPEMRDVIGLSRHMDWMAGIQFYLRQPLDVSPGHIIGLDSSWALTAIEQTQYWRQILLPPDVSAVLSVDISVWDQKGRITRKEAFNCSDEEIAREVWGELKEMLNKRDRAAVLTNDMLVRGPDLEKGVNFHLDESIIDLRDRKKQAFYERARGVEFDTLELIARNSQETQWSAAGKTDGTYSWGPKRRFNVEPLLLNRPGSRALRPEAATSIPNLFLAADYVKTETDLACMEGANEAARRAVNAILDAEAAREPRCRLWSFSPPRQAIEAFLSMSMGGVLRPLRDAATAATQIQGQFWKKLAFGMLRIQGGRSLTPGQLATTALSKRD